MDTGPSNGYNTKKSKKKSGKGAAVSERTGRYVSDKHVNLN